MQGPQKRLFHHSRGLVDLFAGSAGPVQPIAETDGAKVILERFVVVVVGASLASPRKLVARV